MNFQAGSIISINGKKFSIVRVDVDTAPDGKGHFVLVGTKEGDPSFLKGKRTVFTRYLTKGSKFACFTYDWDAK